MRSSWIGILPICCVLIVMRVASFGHADDRTSWEATLTKSDMDGISGTGPPACPWAVSQIPCTSTNGGAPLAENACSKIKPASTTTCAGPGGCDQYCASTSATWVCTNLGGANGSFATCTSTDSVDEYCGALMGGGGCAYVSDSCTCTGGSILNDANNEPRSCGKLQATKTTTQCQ